MSVLAELAALPGVIAAGEYSYRGDRFSFKGDLDDEQARMASIMCRATTMSVHMQVDILNDFCKDCGLNPSAGWVVRGPGFTACAYANIFCFLDNSSASLNDVMGLMRRRLRDRGDELI
ncbi:MAG: DUF2173 family protein [Chromatiales bacterium]|nr:DUF2173 family protein [Chromatiales bacterium]